MLTRMEDIMKQLKKDKESSESQVKALHQDMTSAIKKIKVSMYNKCNFLLCRLWQKHKKLSFLKDQLMKL